MRNPRLTILVPLYREQEWLKSGFGGTWSWTLDHNAKDNAPIDLRFCLWRESDTGEEKSFLMDFIKRMPAGITGKVTMGIGGKPSVAASLRLAIDNPDDPIMSRHTLLCTIDCSPNPAGLDELMAALEDATEAQWIVFRKEYVSLSQSVVMAGSAYLQNHVFVRSLGFTAGPISLLCQRASSRQRAALRGSWRMETDSFQYSDLSRLRWWQEGAGCPSPYS